jgi:hypothetical protein
LPVRLRQLIDGIGREQDRLTREIEAAQAGQPVVAREPRVQRATTCGAGRARLHHQHVDVGAVERGAQSCGLGAVERTGERGQTADRHELGACGTDREPAARARYRHAPALRQRPLELGRAAHAQQVETQQHRRDREQHGAGERDAGCPASRVRRH